MKIYNSDHIRSVALIGHGGCGKTTLATAMAFSAGSSSRLGSVDEGNALTDFTPDEIDRKMSISLALAYAEVKGVKVNIIDTPGYLDFRGEVKAGLRVADSALVVIQANAGVEVGTEIVWADAHQLNLPRMIFINMMDKEHADFKKVLDALKDRLSSRMIPLQIPIGEGADFRGVADLLKNRVLIFKPGTMKDEYKEEEIPSEMKDICETHRQALMETAAESDEALIEKYLEGEELTYDEIIGGLESGFVDGSLFPVLCGAAAKTWGVRSLLEAVSGIVPASTSRKEIPCRSKSGQETTMQCSASSPAAAIIFKTTTEPHVGELSYFRVYSGAIKSGDDVVNVNTGKSERLTHLAIMQGKERVEVDELHMGDLGVVAKLKESHTNDTLAAKGIDTILEPISFPDPVISVAIDPKARGDEEKISTGLAKLQEEDPTFQSRYDRELKQTLISGMGELHLDVIVGRLKRKFNVEAELKRPKIPYRETVRAKAEAQGKYKKQTGGRGQYGDTWLRVEPLGRGEGFEFVNAIVGGAIPSKFIPSVEKGVREAAERGVMAGYPVVDFKATLYDGSFHSVDSSDIAFKIAGSMAFQTVTKQAGLYLLEPILDVEVIVPEEFMGDVIGDLNSRRGKILGITPDGPRQRVKAYIPQAEMYKYSTQLRSLTQGRGTFTSSFSHYEEVPGDISKKIVEEAEAEKEA
ncbi:MAG: elongation factor G [Candidatus Glassbacteria bacterium]